MTMTVDLKKAGLGFAIATVLGLSASPEPVSAAVLEFSWTGTFAMLDPSGNVLFNTSQPNGSKGNNFQTPVSGTLSFDTVSGAGSAAMLPFELLAGTTPATFRGINMESVGGGLLWLGNMLFDWNGTYNIPLSIVWDAAGLLGAIGGGLSINDTVSGVGATPASDGTYVNSPWGYLSLGPTPIATTTFNTTNVSGCSLNDCGASSDQSVPGINPSGGLPLITDTAENFNIGYYTPGNTIGMGGSPMQDGPFRGFNINFDVTNLTLTSTVPVPAAVWLFGSGLAGLIGLGKRRQALAKT